MTGNYYLLNLTATADCLPGLTIVNHTYQPGVQMRREWRTYWRQHLPWNQQEDQKLCTKQIQVNVKTAFQVKLQDTVDTSTWCTWQFVIAASQSSRCNGVTVAGQHYKTGCLRMYLLTCTSLPSFFVKLLTSINHFNMTSDVPEISKQIF